MAGIDAHPGSVTNRAARARHDLRALIGEIIGFSEILEEEAGSLGHPRMTVAFAGVSSGAHALLKRIEVVLHFAAILAEITVHDNTTGVVEPVPSRHREKRCKYDPR